MATFAAQIVTDYSATTDDPFEVDESNPAGDETSNDSTYLTAHGVKAAALVTAYLGDGVSDTDQEALAIGVDAMRWSLAVAAKGITPELVDVKRLLIEQLETMRDARVEEIATPVTYDIDGDAVTPE